MYVWDVVGAVSVRWVSGGGVSDDGEPNVFSEASRQPHFECDTLNMTSFVCAIIVTHSGKEFLKFVALLFSENLLHVNLFQKFP